MLANGTRTEHHGAVQSPMTSRPRVLTTVVGSYPVPDWLAAHPSEGALVDAIRVAYAAQEEAGIDLISDGELGRFDINHPDTNGMIDYFVRPMGGIRAEAGWKECEAFASLPGMRFRSKPAGVVTGPMSAGTLNLVRDCQRSKALSRRPFKFTVTSPFMLAQSLLDTHYGNAAALAMDLACVLAAQVAVLEADVVQVDEANVTGHPELAGIAADCINVVLRSVRGEAAVHLCFGNYGGQKIQKGDWRALIDFMNRLQAGHLVLETARLTLDELRPLADVRPDIGIGLGVIDVKSNLVESPEGIARRLEQAAGLLGAERIRYVHPDCGFWMLKRSVADRKMRALVAGRNLYLGLT